MEDKRITYEKFTGYLREISPVMENPEELTRNIVAQIERINKDKKKHKILHITGLLSGAAAGLLLCLLIHDAIQLSTYHYADTKDTKQTYTISKPEVGKKEIAGIIEEKLKKKIRKEQIYSSYLYKLNNESK